MSPKELCDKCNQPVTWFNFKNIWRDGKIVNRQHLRCPLAAKRSGAKTQSIKPSNVNGGAPGGNAIKPIRSLESDKPQTCGGTAKTPHFKSGTMHAGFLIAGSNLVLSFRNPVLSVAARPRGTTKTTASP